MTFRKPLIALATLVLAMTGRQTDAGITGLYNTGVDGSGALLASGTPDTHYTIMSSPVGSFTPTAISNTPPSYTSPASGSQFIGQAGSPSVANGLYVYQTTFNDTAASGLVSVTLTADDTVSVMLNGMAVGSATLDQGYNSLYSFNISTGFLIGSNTLTFNVTNTHGGPQALDVSFSIVPEPASMVMVALGLGGIYAVRRLRRRDA